MILELRDVSKTYIQGDTIRKALNGVKLKIKDNTLNLIQGPSGSGKSTLISLASLIADPTDGEIVINDRSTSHLSLEDKSLLRRQEIGIIHQRDNLFPFLNLEENVAVPLFGKDKEKTTDILYKAGLKDINKCPGETSLFDQQKVALARALINEPSLILADEPTGELNSNKREEYLNLINELATNCAVLVVSDNNGLKEYFDNVFFLNEGNLRE